MYIKFKVTKSVANITLDRPEVSNAFNAKMLEELLHALRRAEKSPSARVIRIGTSGHNFCAGADISWLRDSVGGSKEYGHHETLLLAEVLQTIWESPKPVMVAVRGVCVGGGLGIVAAADLVAAESEALFRFRENRLGVIPAVVAPYVAAAMGPRQSLRYMLTGDVFTAGRAAVLGLVHMVIEDLKDDTDYVAGLLCRSGPESLTETKKMMREIAWQPIDKDLSTKTSQWLAKVCAGQEAQEGLTAFLEDRCPTWSEREDD